MAGRSALAMKYWAEREITPPSADALFNAILKNSLRQNLARWIGREQLPGKPSDRLRYYFRGQADASWGLSSTLYRAVKSTTRTTEATLAKAESAVIREMRRQGLGHRMSD